MQGSPHPHEKHPSHTQHWAASMHFFVLWIWVYEAAYQPVIKPVLRRRTAYCIKAKVLWKSGRTSLSFSCGDCLGPRGLGGDFMCARAQSLRTIIMSVNLVTTAVNHYSHLPSMTGLVFLCGLQVVLNKEDGIRNLQLLY